MTPEWLRLFIEKIVVGERSKKYSRTATQEIRVCKLKTEKKERDSYDQCRRLRYREYAPAAGGKGAFDQGRSKKIAARIAVKEQVNIALFL